MSTQLAVRLQGVDNARDYEVQVKNGTGGWLLAASSRAHGIGGSTGHSDWCDLLSHMVL